LNANISVILHDKLLIFSLHELLIIWLFNGSYLVLEVMH